MVGKVRRLRHVICTPVKFIHRGGGALFSGPFPPPRMVMAMAKEKKGKNEEETTAEGVLGAFLPGLGKMISNLKNTSPSFKQRLEETDEEIERRIAAGGPRRPVIDCNVRVRTLAPEEDTGFRPLVKKRGQGPCSSKPRPGGADIFDEKDKIVVVVELHGVKKEEINVEVNGDVVEISAREYKEKIKLPSKVSGKPVIKFKNGILELGLAKKGTR